MTTLSVPLLSSSNFLFGPFSVLLVALPWIVLNILMPCRVNSDGPNSGFCLSRIDLFLVNQSTNVSPSSGVEGCRGNG